MPTLLQHGGGGMGLTTFLREMSDCSIQPP